jgi:hypothetical protein
MASRIPARTVWSQRKTLEDYEGTLTEQLGSLLRAFGLSTDIPVKTYTYKDDGTVVKYRVVIILPDGLAPSSVQPSGEGRGETAAYHKAVVRAIVTIREYRAVELAGTTFQGWSQDFTMRGAKKTIIFFEGRRPQWYMSFFFTMHLNMCCLYPRKFGR